MTTADRLDVNTTLLTLCLWAALITDRVPSTAGLIRTFSSLGTPLPGTGDAVWTT
jgi:hypothetical protein